MRFDVSAMVLMKIQDLCDKVTNVLEEVASSIFTIVQE